jgi:transcription elongation factor Elf1
MQKVVNLIYGEKPEFGNPKHIAFVQRIEKIFKGECEVSIIEWEYYNKKGRNVFNPENGCELRHTFQCPRCNNDIIISCSYTFCKELWYQTLIEIDEKCFNMKLKCTKCNQKFYCDDENEDGEIGIYVK